MLMLGSLLIKSGGGVLFVAENEEVELDQHLMSNTCAQGQGGEGSTQSDGDNVIRPISDANKKTIHILGVSNYKEFDVPGRISKIYKAHFRGSETQWHRIDPELKNHMFKVFEDEFKFETVHDKVISRNVRETRANKLCQGIWGKLRLNCKEVTGSSNPANWIQCRPGWVKTEDWPKILKHWMSDEWIKLFESGSVPGEELSGNHKYVKPIGGSISFEIHRDRLATELGREPKQLELFGRVHWKDKGKGEWCDAKSGIVAEKYQLKITEKSNIQSRTSEEDILYDHEVWTDAVGGPKKNRVYSFGLTNDAETVLGPEFCPSSSRKRMRPIVFQEMEARMQEMGARLEAREANVEALAESLQAREAKVVALAESLQAREAKVEALAESLQARDARMEETIQRRIKELLESLQISTFPRPPPTT